MFSKFFIDRPVFTAVLFLVITLTSAVAGAAALLTLPVTEYPETEKCYNAHAMIGSGASPLCIQRRPSSSIRSIARLGPHKLRAYSCGGTASSSGSC